MLPTITRRFVPALLLGFACWGARAQQPDEEVVSFRCTMALDAVISALDSQAGNPVTQQALDRIDEDSGEFVCIRVDAKTIAVRLQTPDMSPTEGKLVFTVDARTYEVLKTYFGP